MGFNFDWSNRLFQTKFAAFVSLALGNLFTFIAVITPAWQVAYDADANRHVESGLWMYCPGSQSQCWYIFSDDLINYYERVEVCRFLLIGDCRQKLLRTPYFFGWHYAVLVLCIITLISGTLALACCAVGWFCPRRLRLATVFLSVFTFIAILLLSIGLAVFMINAEMLESKYLIGIKNTFPKEYGYSMYLAGFGALFYSFALLVAILLTTYVFLMGMRHPAELENQYYPGSKSGTLPRPEFEDLHSPSRISATPTSQWPTAQRGEGTFTPTTRHFYSY